MIQNKERTAGCVSTIGSYAMAAGKHCIVRAHLEFYKIKMYLLYHHENINSVVYQYMYNHLSTYRYIG